MHWLVAVFAAASGFTMSFAICTFVWAWYVGTVVLMVSNREPAVTVAAEGSHADLARLR